MRNRYLIGMLNLRNVLIGSLQMNQNITTHSITTLKGLACAYFERASAWTWPATTLKGLDRALSRTTTRRPPPRRTFIGWIWTSSRSAWKWYLCGHCIMAVRRQCKDVVYLLQEPGGGVGVSSPSLYMSYAFVCLSFPLYLCLLHLPFLFVRVRDILLTVEQGRGLPRT